MSSTSTHGSQSVKKRTLASVLTSQLRQRIIDGSYPPGTQLNEVEIAAQFATSRGPVREGLQRLVQEGLLVSEPHRGVFVPVLDDDDLDDLYFVRSAVERACMLRLIDRGLTAATLASLEHALGEMGVAIGQEDWLAVASADLRFHEVIVAASGSPRMVRLYASLAGETRLGINLLVGTYEGRADYLEEHTRIFARLAARDRQGLLHELEAHLDTALATLQRHPEKASDGRSGRAAARPRRQK